LLPLRIQYISLKTVFVYVAALKAKHIIGNERAATVFGND
jgi:hypothetical protein